MNWCEHGNCKECGVSEKFVERFWRYVQKSSPNKCWKWVGAISGNKYGSFWNGERQIKAHRFSYIIHNGKIPSNLIVMHKCDNMVCVNPNHLQLGTNKDNIQDALTKGRMTAGESFWASKATDELVIKIRNEFREPFTLLEECKRLNRLFPEIAPSTIRKIVRRETWKHLK